MSPSVRKGHSRTLQQRTGRNRHADHWGRGAMILLLTWLCVLAGAARGQAVLYSHYESKPWLWSRPVDFPVQCPPGVEPEDVVLLMLPMYDGVNLDPRQQPLLMRVPYDAQAGVHRAHLFPSSYQIQELVAAPAGKEDSWSYEHRWHVSSLLNTDELWLVPLSMEPGPPSPFILPTTRLIPSLSLEARTVPADAEIQFQVAPCEDATYYDLEFYGALGSSRVGGPPHRKVRVPEKRFYTLETREADATVSWADLKRRMRFRLASIQYPGSFLSDSGLGEKDPPDECYLGVSCRAVARDQNGNPVNESGMVPLGQEPIDLSFPVEPPGGDGAPSRADGAESSMHMDLEGAIVGRTLRLTTSEIEGADAYVFRLYAYPLTPNADASSEPAADSNGSENPFRSISLLTRTSERPELDVSFSDLHCGLETLRVYMRSRGSRTPSEQRGATGADTQPRWILRGSVTAWGRDAHLLGASPSAYLGEVREDDLRAARVVGTSADKRPPLPRLDLDGNVGGQGIGLTTAEVEGAHTYVFRLFVFPCNPRAFGSRLEFSESDGFDELWADGLILVQTSGSPQLDVSRADLRPGLAMELARHGWAFVEPRRTTFTPREPEPIQTVTAVDEDIRWMVRGTVSAWDRNANPLGVSPSVYLGDMPENYLVGIRYRRLPEDLYP